MKILFFLFLSWITLKGDDLAGFPASRYEPLWKNSPFTVATPNETAKSADYSLVGVSEFNGVSYVNLIDKQTNATFLLSSSQPKNGLTLISIQHEAKKASSAVLSRQGETITLKIEAPPSASPAMASALPPQGVNPPTQFAPPQHQPPPPVAIRRMIIHVPTHP